MQTKQVSLFPSTAVGINKIYSYDWRQNNDRVGVSAEFQNSEANGLGLALPAGRVRVYQASGKGSQEFIGEDNVEHTPKNEKVTVRIGNAFDIVAERTQTDYRRISDRVAETDIQVKLRNHKKEAVEVVVTDYFYGDWESSALQRRSEEDLFQQGGVPRLRHPRAGSDPHLHRPHPQLTRSAFVP